MLVHTVFTKCLEIFANNDMLHYIGYKNLKFHFAIFGKIIVLLVAKLEENLCESKTDKKI
jgi:hypothetical protein